MRGKTRAMTRAQENALGALRGDLRRLRKRLQVLHDRTEYEDLAHGILALEIAEHAVNEALERTGLSGEIRSVSNPTAHRQALRWHKTVKDVRAQGVTLLRTHASEDLETALKALDIAAGSLEEVAEHYE
jgi:transposase InsO family protein